MVTEPVAYPLSYLLDNYKMKWQVPGMLEIKLILLQIMEGLHFLHNNMKMVHLNISPENIYITKTGGVKIAGFNCLTTCSPGSSTWVNFLYNPYMSGQLALAPNLRFSSPEVCGERQVSFASDLYSIGLLIFYMLKMDEGKEPYALKMETAYSSGSHGSACTWMAWTLETDLWDYPFDL